MLLNLWGCLWGMEIGIAEEFWNSFAGNANICLSVLCAFMLMGYGNFLSIHVKCSFLMKRICPATSLFISWFISCQWWRYWRADFSFCAGGIEYRSSTFSASTLLTSLNGAGTLPMRWWIHAIPLWLWPECFISMAFLIWSSIRLRWAGRFAPNRECRRKSENNRELWRKLENNREK